MRLLAEPRNGTGEGPAPWGRGGPCFPRMRPLWEWEQNADARREELSPNEARGLTLDPTPWQGRPKGPKAPAPRRPLLGWPPFTDTQDPLDRAARYHARPAV